MNNLEVSETQDSLLRNLVDSMIPETDAPGALSLGLNAFVWVMVDDCLDKSQQDTFLQGLSSFESSYEKMSEEPFQRSSPVEQTKILTRMTNSESENQIPKEVFYLIETTKSFAALGFMQSEFVMTEVMPYALVPGKPPVCRTIDPNDQINIYA